MLIQWVDADRKDRLCHLRDLIEPKIALLSFDVSTILVHFFTTWAFQRTVTFIKILKSVADVYAPATSILNSCGRLQS